MTDDDMTPMNLGNGILELSRERHTRRLEDIEHSGASLSRSARSMLQALGTCAWWVIPPELTAQEYLRLTTASDEADVDARLRLCEQCPTRGGKCQDSQNPGKGPVWRNGFVWAPCQKWRVHMVDQVLIRLGYPERIAKMSFADFEPEDEQAEVLEACMSWAYGYVGRSASDAKGEGVWLCGNCGTGKTHLAVSMVRSLHQHRLIDTSRFLETDYLISVLRRHDEKSAELLDQALVADVLILDDFNMSLATEWGSSQIAILIKDRWAASRPTLFTANESLSEAAASLGPRTVSRLVQTTKIYALNGPDHRFAS